MIGKPIFNTMKMARSRHIQQERGRRKRHLLQAQETALILVDQLDLQKEVQIWIILFLLVKLYEPQKQTHI